MLNESAGTDRSARSESRKFWGGGGRVKASRGAIRLPGGGYIFAGTERGLGIPEPPLSLSCSYDSERDEVALRWVNPAGGYDSILVLLNWSNYDHRGGDSIGGAATSFVIDRKKRPVDVKDLDVWVIGYRDNIPSNAAAIHLSGNSQEELYGIPFSNNVAPNWRAWVIGGEPDTVEFGQGVRRKFLHLEGKRYNPIRRAATKPFYQVIKTNSANVRGGVFRKFLGLKPGHTYRISGRLNTFEMDSAKRDWALSLHAAHNSLGGAELRVEQLSGLAALPDGSKGAAAGRIASYEPKLTTNGTWQELSTGKAWRGSKVADIKLPAGVDSITVWVRHSGADSTGVGIDWVKLEDVSMVKPK